MAIPKIIYQTYSNNSLPIITRLFIWWMKFVNRDYRYEFYDDKRIEKFLKECYPEKVFAAYQKINIGAAKGDFFRYAMLLKTGGVYIDVDGAILRKLSLIIQPNDMAVISREVHPGLYVQWALIFDKEHPFLKRTLQNCIRNIEENRFPNDVGYMTGPAVYSESIRECLSENPDIPYREFGVDYNRRIKGIIIPKHFLNRMIYFKREHWMKTQKKQSVLKLK
jgi:inositol phosphorylceramide mannosyltransferase catalytic subunit